MGDRLKYQQVKAHIINLIESEHLAAGSRLPSENELSVRFGFSRHTVRQAIGELANEGFVQRLHGKGTFIAKRPLYPLPGKRIGVLTTYLSDYIFPKIINGIDDELSRVGYDYILSCTFNDTAKERVALTAFLNQDIRGLIIEPTKSALQNPNLDLYRKLLAKGVEILFIHGNYADFKAPYVAQDDFMGGYQACAYLAEQGYEKIGGIFKFDDVQGRFRQRGMEKALQEWDVKSTEADFLWFNEYHMPPEGLPLFIRGDNRYGTVKKLSQKQVRRFLKNHQAVVVYNEVLAITIIEIIKELNLKIPDDIGIVSFDDSDIARAFSPKLTTIAHPKEALGRLAARGLIDRMERAADLSLHASAPPPPLLRAVKMPPELVVRESCRQLPRKTTQA